MMDLPGETEITVCDACLMACCWQGSFMCDEAQSAGTVKMPVSVLRDLKRENPEYWAKDYELRLSGRLGELQKRLAEQGR